MSTNFFFFLPTSCGSFHLGSSEFLSVAVIELGDVDNTLANDDVETLGEPANGVEANGVDALLVLAIEGSTGKSMKLEAVGEDSANGDVPAHSLGKGGDCN